MDNICWLRSPSLLIPSSEHMSRLWVRHIATKNSSPVVIAYSTDAHHYKEIENGEEGQNLVGALTGFIAAMVRNLPVRAEIHMQKKGIDHGHLKYEWTAQLIYASQMKFSLQIDQP